MSASAALVGAAAALLGALIGGTATLLAGRIQWRRESRQKAYAELLTASHEVRWWLEGHQPSASSCIPRFWPPSTRDGTRRVNQLQ